MKNTILIGLSLLAVGGSFASQAPTLNYSDIVSQYTDHQLSDVSTAIKLVEEHCNNLKAQRSVYAPRALRVLGAGLGLVAGIGVIGLVGGAYGAYTILNSSENSNIGAWLSKQPKDIQEKARENERGVSYSDFLKKIYLGIEIPAEKERITNRYIGSGRNYVENNPLGAAAITTGAFAPVALPISLVLAGLSKYFFNEAASYQDPVLEDLIAQDEKMLADLRAQKAMLS